MVTDAGQLRLFELKQSGNLDKAVFPLPVPGLPTPAEGTPVRGVVFPAEEAAFWVLANGSLQKFRLGLVPSRGIEMLPVGTRISLGEATQIPQLNSRKDAVCLVVRSQNSDGCKAVLMSLRDGEFRWQRQLGVVPATSPIPQEDGLLLVAKDGGLLLVPSTVKSVPGPGKAAPGAWAIAPPPENVSSSTAVAVSTDGKTIYTVTQVTANEDLKSVPKYLVRRVVGGKVVHEGSAVAPTFPNGTVDSSLAGPPVVVGGALLLPLADGFVYRHMDAIGSKNPDKLLPGPHWSGDQRIDPSIKCYITPVSDTAFLTSDGSKRLTRWDWPDDGRGKQTGLGSESSTGWLWPVASTNCGHRSRAATRC